MLIGQSNQTDGAVEAGAVDRTTIAHLRKMARDRAIAALMAGRGGGVGVGQASGRGRLGGVVTGLAESAARREQVSEAAVGDGNLGSPQPPVRAVDLDGRRQVHDPLAHITLASLDTGLSH
jgi:hypothetical protein